MFTPSLNVIQLWVRAVVVHLELRCQLLESASGIMVIQQGSPRVLLTCDISRLTLFKVYMKFWDLECVRRFLAAAMMTRF